MDGTKAEGGCLPAVLRCPASLLEAPLRWRGGQVLEAAARQVPRLRRLFSRRLEAVPPRSGRPHQPACSLPARRTRRSHPQRFRGCPTSPANERSHGAGRSEVPGLRCARREARPGRGSTVLLPARRPRVVPMPGLQRQFQAHEHPATRLPADDPLRCPRRPHVLHEPPKVLLGRHDLAQDPPHAGAQGGPARPSLRRVARAQADGRIRAFKTDCPRMSSRASEACSSL